MPAKPALRVVRRPAPAPGVRDAMFALCLALVLTVGVVGVLLLNTSMQQQSQRLDVARQQVATLSVQLQELRTQLDRESTPSLLATRARRLHMRPVATPRFAAVRPVSERPRAAARGRAG